ncbi:MAG: hypothetical protein IMZ52_01670 [Actinobacteria bacterium]|nr:hypothetical protein [Actinomycetota bacterium]MBE3114809.1 hypothetical protein [Actinomycetota bacterium]
MKNIDLNKTPYILRYAFDDGIYLAKIVEITEYQLNYKVIRIIKEATNSWKVNQTTGFRLESATELKDYNLTKMDEYKLLTENEALVWLI